MRFVYLSFFLNLLSKNIPHQPKIFHSDSFVGSWVLYENDKKNKDVIHLQPQGRIYKTINIHPTSYTERVGSWDSNENEFYFNIKDKNYYGEIYNNTLKITGWICEGIFSPCYITNFTIIPLFEQFHNITYVNNSNSFVYLTQKNVTGKWLFENINTNQIYLLELHKNNTWNTVSKDKYVLRGKWNLFNESHKINTNVFSKSSGKNIWLSIVAKKDQSYSNYNIMYIGKITQLGYIYYYNEDLPSSMSDSDQNKITISSKINGSIVYCYEMDPEISENFYMKRWF